MFNQTILSSWSGLKTPFYFYDLNLLEQTTDLAKSHSSKHGFNIHYALKANSNNEIVNHMQFQGFGADCVSGNEIKKAIECGINPVKIVYAGVGKTDDEIEFAINTNIFCFNVESINEVEVINEIALRLNKTAPIALRINPNVNANTHQYITTGLNENKFGINIWELSELVEHIKAMSGIKLIGLHFHIGSQVTDMEVFRNLCNRVNYISEYFENKRIPIQHLNMGGGLGINYNDPNKHPICDFETYFGIFKNFLNVKPNQQVHFELGRSLVAQCGSLISRVLYIKKGIKTNFMILDAGMTELIRPALYQAVHSIENLTKEYINKTPLHEYYDVVGPICESSDCFGKSVKLPFTERGDLIAIRSAGAYGEVMASNYNLREKPKAIYKFI